MFLNSSVSFVITDLIGQRTKVGDAVGTLGFSDELVALVACPAWGVVSDRLGVRIVSYSSHRIFSNGRSTGVRKNAITYWVFVYEHCGTTLDFSNIIAEVFSCSQPACIVSRLVWLPSLPSSSNKYLMSTIIQDLNKRCIFRSSRI